MAGAGYKLFNTGDVLTAAQVNTYLQEQAVMVFANAAARTTALSGVLAEGMITYLKDTDAVEKYDGSSWISVAGASSPLTTKGDLYTYSTTNARLAVGNNGETLVADSGATTGLRWQSAANANAVINGGMDIWQRGTSFAGASTGFCADRWRAFRGAAGSTFSRQSSGLTGVQYALRMQRDSGNTATNGISTWYTAESADAYRFAGQTVTLSFWARAGANFSATSNNINVTLQTGTGTDQAYGSFTGASNVISTTQAITTSWVRYSFTASIASSATQFAIEIYYNPTGTAGANDWMDITGVQLEVGSVATTFKRAGVTLAGELAACQRYYYRITTATTYGDFGAGYQKSTTVGSYMIPFPVIMRIAPTALEQTGTASNYNILHQSAGAAARTTCSSVPTFQTATTAAARVDATVASGLTAGNGGIFGADNNTTAYLAWSAEL